MNTRRNFRLRAPRWMSAGSMQYQRGKMGYILLWLLGVPIPILLLFYLLRGCT